MPMKPFSFGETPRPLPVRTRMERAANGRVIAQICRGFQVVSAAVILVFSIRLTLRWSELNHLCGSSTDKECEKIAQGLGALKYCISVGSLAVVDLALWLIDTYLYPFPWFVVYGSAQITAGFCLGGGCTLAALINGWNCQSGVQGGSRLCQEYYANVAIMYAQVLVSWTGLAAWCYMKKHHQPDNFSRMS